MFACAITLSQADSVNDLLLPGQVILGHMKLESECSNCHKQFDKGAQSGLCKDCHKDIAKDINAKHGFHGLMQAGKECKECHTEHKGRNATIAKLEKIGFDHGKQTGFELKGGHLNSKVLCKDCHFPQKKFRDAPTKCNSCHERVDKHKGKLGPECQNCHEEKDWKTTHFDHSKTHFPLEGKHIDVSCVKCHVNNQFKETPKSCNECHKKDDKHKANFGIKCETCHTDRDWKEILFNHDKATKYPLKGKHHEVKCTSCHKGNLYREKLKTDCYSCHKKDDKHKGTFGLKCESCHIERGWKEIPFDHNKKTKFPLRGKHEDVKCTSCHKGDLYKDKLKMDCYSCHKKDDKHKGTFSIKCESCHTDRDWKEILFDHDKKTKFPLFGEHDKTKCVICHKGDIYKEKLKTDCYSCHEKDDKHKGQEGKKCETCHKLIVKKWKVEKFDHGLSKFPLTGRHILVECNKCHATVLFKDTKSDCWSCHQKDDVHKRRLGTACESCHNVRNWKAWDFDHNKTNFKLDGPHAKLGCYECHKEPMTKKLTVDSSCGGCHLSDDIHNGEYGRQCERCHIGSSWKKIKIGGRFLH